MNLNRRGQAVAGNAGVGVWLQGVVIRPGNTGFPNWLDDDTIVYNGVAKGTRACDADGGNDREVDAESGAPVYGRGGTWVTFISGRGLKTSWGLVLADAAPLGIGPDGTLYATTYQTQADLRVYRAGSMTPDGLWASARPMVSLGSTPGHLSALDAFRFVWADQSLRLQSVGLPTPAQVAENAYQPTIVEPLPDVFWLVYRTQSGRGVVHPMGDATRGYAVPAEVFGFTAWCPSPGVIECCWAIGTGNVGEVGPITRQQFIAADDVDLPAMPPADDLPSVEPLGTRLLGFFNPVSIRYGARVDDAPGNCAVQLDEVDGEGRSIVGAAELAGTLDLPLVVDAASLAFARRPIALWLSNGTLDGLLAAYATNDLRRDLRRLAYLDRYVGDPNGWAALTTRPAGFGPEQIVGLQAYCPIGGDLAVFGRDLIETSKRVRAVLGDAQELGYVCQAWDRRQGPTAPRDTEDRCVQIAALVVAIAHRFGAHLFPFHATRPGGIVDLARLRRFWRQVAEAIADLPAWARPSAVPTVPPVTPPHPHDPAPPHVPSQPQPLQPPSAAPVPIALFHRSNTWVR